MLREDDKMIWEQRQSKVKKGYSQDLVSVVKQTVAVSSSLRNLFQPLPLGLPKHRNTDSPELTYSVNEDVIPVYSGVSQA